MGCLTEQELSEYACSELAVERQMRMDEHLAECDQCAKRVSESVASADLFDEWTAAEHGRVLRVAELVKRLRPASAEKPEVTGLLNRLCGSMGRLVDWLHVLIDPERRLACAAAGAVGVGTRFRLLLRQSGIGAAEDLAKVSQELETSSELLSKGDVRQALDTLEQVKRVDALACSGSTAELRDEADRPRVEIGVDAVRRLIRFKFWPPEGCDKAVALLLPVDQRAQPLICEMEAISGEGYLLAEFEDLPEGVTNWEACAVRLA